jgi:elongation factor Tu
MEVRELLTK